jgi:hypothetical protein
MELVPGVHETVLCKVIGRGDVTAQLAKEISHMRLMATHQLSESRGVL